MRGLVSQTIARRFGKLTRHHFLPMLCFLVCAVAVSTLWAGIGERGWDLIYHLSSWLDLAANWKSGESILGWAWGANFGWGDAHLSLYPPLTFIIGGVLTLFMPPALVPAAYTSIVLFLSGTSMFYGSNAVIRERRRRIAAGLVYEVTGYLLMTAFHRFAAAELLVEAVLPAFLFSIFIWVSCHCIKSVMRAGICSSVLLATAIISNIPATVVIVGLTSLVVAFWAVITRTFRPVMRWGISLAVASMLASFYLLPFIEEHKWVRTDQFVRIDPESMLIFMSDGSGGRAQTWTMWIIVVLELLVIIASFAALRRASKPAKVHHIFTQLFVCGLVSSFFMSPFSLLIWRHLPLLSFVQLPVRVLSFLGVSFATLIVTQRRWGVRSWLTGTVLVLALLPFVGHVLAQRSPAFTFPAIPDLIKGWTVNGYAGMPEAVPVKASLPILLQGGLSKAEGGCKVIQFSPDMFGVQHTSGETMCLLEIPYFFSSQLVARTQSGTSLPTFASPRGWLEISVPGKVNRLSVVPIVSRLPLALGNCRVFIAADHHFKVTHFAGGMPCEVQIPALFYPYLHAVSGPSDGVELPVTADSAGRIIVSVPNPVNDFNIRFEAQSPLRSLGICVSFLTVVMLGLVYRRFPMTRRGEPTAV